MEEVYEMISDPGHGWLKVPLKDVEQLGIMGLISEFSYKSKDYAYLEEDCDLWIFMKAMREIGKNVKYTESVTQHFSHIRSYARFA